ncbi:bifunctional 4-hydroxy-2-oxoglutarate aldolase/2-dehydro-3-deoxy-phosphogluconate aldolase [Luedemannella flava]|uniref:Bifunctional 4-hydroxy-2-oxoglutarate aldolase/2-dehydro-3-deoxy-phosphogluconate aldolase n=1 Tax=Luedemannella flava TaxID=349316 RepID=A0ABP4XUY9_9ACTN
MSQEAFPSGPPSPDDLRLISDQLAATRLLPVVVISRAADARPLADALAEGGLRTAEVTMRTPAAIDAIRALAEVPDLLVGAGTVLTRAHVEQAVDAGAAFIVSPGFSPEVVTHCAALGVPVFPGVASPSEIMQAFDHGLRTLKFFPAEQLGGAPMVKALAAPFADARFIPTGGVTAASLPGYLALPSVLAVGGSWMVAPKLLDAGDWKEVTRLTAEAVALAKESTNAAA